MDFSAIDQQMTEAVEKGVFPGVVVLVNQAGTPLYRRAFGWRSLEPVRAPVSEETVFDIASLTKPLATTVALMLLVKEKQLRLTDRVAYFLPEFAAHGKADVTIRHLLSHSSGLPAWRPYYREILQLEAQRGQGDFLGTQKAREYVYTLIESERLEASPGQRALYSDLDFMLLGAIVEKLSGMELDQYCLDNIFRPLGLQQTAFINLGKRRQGALPFPLGQVAPTERCPWRNRILCAEVHDDNAYAMGGVAGHAGLFSAIDDLNQLVNCLLACYRGEHCFLPSALLREFWTRDETVSGSTWALGWDTPSLSHSSAGELFSAHSVGHLGFTGTSLWIDLERQLYVIILSNRVHPRRDNDKIKTFRPVLHNTIMRIVLGRK